MSEAGMKISRQAPKNPRKNNKKANDAELAAKTMDVPASSVSSAMDIGNALRIRIIC